MKYDEDSNVEIGSSSSFCDRFIRFKQGTYPNTQARQTHTE
jgi:hypothetical protein